MTTPFSLPGNSDGAAPDREDSAADNPPAYKGFDAADLEAFGHQIERHEEAVRTAQAALDDDRKKRSASVTARLVDFFTTTKEEASLEEAEARLAEAVSVATDAAGRWIEAGLRHRVSRHPELAGRHARLSKALQDSEAELASARTLVDAGSQARTALDEAVDACGSAESMETLDMLTSSKAVSFMSSSSTASASERVREATQSLEKLKVALGASVPSLVATVPSDQIDLLLDFAVDMPVDFMSWSNRASLEKAKQECERTRQYLAHVLEALERSLEEREEALSTAAAALSAFEGPILKRLLDGVPRVLRRRLASNPRYAVA